MYAMDMVAALSCLPILVVRNVQQLLKVREPSGTMAAEAWETYRDEKNQIWYKKKAGMPP